MPRNSGRGARHIVRYVFRKGSQINQGLRSGPSSPENALPTDYLRSRGPQGSPLAGERIKRGPVWGGGSKRASAGRYERRPETNSARGVGGGPDRHGPERFSEVTVEARFSSSQFSRLSENLTTSPWRWGQTHSLWFISLHGPEVALLSHARLTRGNHA
jgi:hypothetical protein